MKKNKKAFKKYRKAILMVAAFLVVSALGFSVSGGLLADFFIKIVFNSEVAVLLAVLTKAALIGGGAILAIVNGIKAYREKKNIETLEDDEKEIVNYLEHLKSEQEEKAQSLEEELRTAKEKNKMASKDEKKEISDPKSIEIEYDKSDVKVKRK